MNVRRTQRLLLILLLSSLTYLLLVGTASNQQWIPRRIAAPFVIAGLVVFGLAALATRALGNIRLLGSDPEQSKAHEIRKGVIVTAMGVLVAMVLILASLVGIWLMRG